MRSYKETINQLVNQHQKITQSLKSQILKNSKYYVFGNIKFYVDTDFSLFSDNELIMYHSMAHTLFSFKNKSDIKNAHKKIVEVMKKRGISHQNFDFLDKV